ncbi:hypothetical protein DFH06DRAFT_285196 [Mycena polygramma]|nr:hypothetical protein DFH06DRAFT_285196 [Mycena polygramma]
MISQQWLSQANHIFTCLHIASNLEDYATVFRIDFKLRISQARDAPPPTGYLFVCPPKNFQTGSNFCWPKRPAYWAVDPSGIDRLTAKEATQLGFPSIELETRIGLESWDTSVYAGLREFHVGKGFDPDSQDLARHLGYPLYEVIGEVEAPCARVTDEPSENDEDSNPGLADEAVDRRPLHVQNPEVPLAQESFQGEPNQKIPANKKHELLVHKATTAPDRDSATVSRTLTLFVSVQLALISFVAFIWLHDYTRHNT